MSRQPQRGPQNPGKYPIEPGPKYQYYGEQPGWVYDPYSDTYLPDPKESQEYYEESGLKEKEEEPPGVGEQLAYTGAGVLTIWGMKKGGQYVVDSVTGEATNQGAQQGAQVGGQAATPPAAGGGATPPAAQPQTAPGAGAQPTTPPPSAGGSAGNPGMMGGAESGGAGVADPGMSGGGVAQTPQENIDFNAAGAEASGYDVTLTLEDGSVVSANSAEGQAALDSGQEVGVNVKPAEAGSGGGYYQTAQTALYAAGAIFGAYNAYKMYDEGDYVGGTIAAGGAAVAGYNAYASYVGSAVIPMWWMLPVYAAYLGYKNYKALGEAGIHPGEYTEEELQSITHPDMMGEQGWAESIDKRVPEVPGFGKGPMELVMKDTSPMGTYTIEGQIARKLFGSGKNEGQIMRDRIRENFGKMATEMGEAGGVEGFRKNDETGSYEMLLADGSWYDIGRDGQSGFTGWDGKTHIKHGYEVDTSHPLHHLAAGLINPLMTTVMHGKEGKGHDIIAQLINGSLSNVEGGSPEDLEKLMQNVRQLYISMGLTDKEVAYQVTEGLMAEGKISEEEARAYQNSLNAIFTSEDDPYPMHQLLEIENPGNYYGYEQGVAPKPTGYTDEELPEPRAEYQPEPGSGEGSETQPQKPEEAPQVNGTPGGPGTNQPGVSTEGQQVPGSDTANPQVVGAPGTTQELQPPADGAFDENGQPVTRPTPDNPAQIPQTRSAQASGQPPGMMRQGATEQPQPGEQAMTDNNQLPPDDIRNRFVNNEPYINSIDPNQQRENPGMMGRAPVQVSPEQVQIANESNVPGQISSQMNQIPVDGSQQGWPQGEKPQGGDSSFNSVIPDPQVGDQVSTLMGWAPGTENPNIVHEWNGEEWVQVNGPEVGAPKPPSGWTQGENNQWYQPYQPQMQHNQPLTGNDLINQYINMGMGPQSGVPQSQGQPPAQWQQDPNRTSTLSPGIGLDGKPIRY